MLDTLGIAASRKRIAPFDLLRPTSLATACVDLRASFGRSVRLHAGGLDLVNQLKLGNTPDVLVDLSEVAELRHIEASKDELKIGAMVRHAQIEADPLVRALRPELADYVRDLGNIRVRTQGTIGGNVMSDDPFYEMLPFLCAVGAHLHFIDWTTTRSIKMSALDWLAARQKVATILLRAISIPLRSATVIWFRELRPQLGCVVALNWQDDAAVNGTAAMTGDREGPNARSITFPTPLRRDIPQPEIDALAMQWRDAFPVLDTNGGLSADYAHHVLGVWLRRALGRTIAGHA